MTDFYDPFAYNDDENDPEYDYSSYSNPWLDLGAIGGGEDTGGSFFPDAYSTAKWNFGAQQPSGIDQLNKKLTALKSMNSIFKDPMFNQMVSNSYPEAGAFDYGGFVPGGGVTGEDAGFDLDSLGQTISSGIIAGLGGGTGKGGSYNPNYDSSKLDAAMNSSDDVIRNIAAQVAGGKIDPSTIKAGLLNARDKKTNQPLSPEAQKLYSATVDDLWGVAAGGRTNDALAAAAGLGGKTPKAGPLAQAWAKTGMRDPSDMYGPDHLPADMQPYADQFLYSPFMEQQGRNISDAGGSYQKLRAMYNQLNTPALKGTDWAEQLKYTPPPRLANAADTKTSTGSIAPQFGKELTAAHKKGRTYSSDKDPQYQAALKDYVQTRAMAAQQDQRNRTFNNAKYEYTRMQKHAEEADNLVRGAKQFWAEQAQRQGRTPARDRENAQFAMLRRLTGL